MATIYRFAGAELQREQRRLLVNGADSGVGARAFDLLLALIDRHGELVGKHELIEQVWPGLVVEENNLQAQISGLRKLLGAQVIATIPGRGYRFTALLEDSPQDQVKSPVGTTATGALDAVAEPLTNLPKQLPTLFGRDADLLALQALIQSHPLVTVAGAGGIGKTSLAQTVAHRLRGAFDDGVWAIELASVGEASLVMTTVAGVLQVALGAAASVATLAKALSANRMLIVLDNCEHLLLAIAELAAALHREAPNVRLLATSQEPLKLPHEHLYRLASLALPVDDGVASARQAGAVALFEARARVADPRFELVDGNVAAVVDICRQLDGIALAIELAAARVLLLGVEGLQARLGERLQLLTAGARLALPRHRTLRAALQWSHGLLTTDEQTVFRRLGVFAGSFDLASAQRVATDGNIDDWAALDLLGALVDKSLVVVEPVGEAREEPRYRLLESSRAFALEKAQQAGEVEVVRRRHADAMLVVFERARADEYLLTGAVRLARLLPDLDNARAALDWSAGPDGDAALHVALSGAVGWVWIEAGLRSEGFRRAKVAIEMIGPDTPPRFEARLLREWAWLAHPVIGAQELAANARVVEIYRALDDRRALYSALCNQARYQPYCNQIAEAEAALYEAEQLFQPDWPVAMRARYLTSRSNLNDVQERYEASIPVLEELHQLALTLGDKRMVVMSLINVEQTYASLGRLEESVARGRELLALMQQDRSLRSGSEHFALVNLNMSLIRLGRIDEALVVARRAVPVVARVDRTLDMVEQCALLAFKRGRVEDAARMMGRADHAFATSDFRRDPVEQGIRKSLEASLAGALFPAELARLLREGASLSVEAALDLGLRE